MQRPASLPPPQLVVDLLGQMLDVAEKAAAASGSSRRGLGHEGTGRGGLHLRGLAGVDEAEEEDSGKQELAALMQKLRVGTAGWIGEGLCRHRVLCGPGGPGAGWACPIAAANSLSSALGDSQVLNRTRS